MTDIDLLTSFEHCNLPWDEWTHLSHLRMAYLSLEKYGNKKGSQAIINGIKKYNNFHSDKKMTIGYHQTITLFWINTVKLRMHKFDSFSKFKINNQDIFDFSYIFDFYEKKMLYSDKAKIEFSKPNKEK